MHGVWEWDGEKKAGAVLVESYFVNDPTTGRKVRLHSSRLAEGAIDGGAGRLVYRFLLPVLEAVDGAGAWRSSQRTRSRESVLRGAST